LKSSSVNKALIYLLAALFLASGVLHLVNPAAFLWLMPPWLPEHNSLILLSGVFELACAIGLLAKVRWSGYLSALVLLAIWPANIWYAFDVLNQENTGLMVAAWLRLPLQIPFIYAAIKFARNRV
jgi:uncharacterized membrane protein